MSAKILRRAAVETAGGKMWRVVRSMEFAMDGVEYKVPIGFKTDFASLPRTVRPLITGMAVSRDPALAHDYLYAGAPTLEEIQMSIRPAKPDYTRKAADMAFKALLLAESASAWKTFLLYRGVRLGGWVHENWRAWRKQSKVA